MRRETDVLRRFFMELKRGNKNETKKLFSLLLSLALVVGMIPAFTAPVYAAYHDVYASTINSQTSGDYEYYTIISGNSVKVIALNSDVYLRLDEDLTATMITGGLASHNLHIVGDGTKKLTVNSPGIAINVNNLTMENCKASITGEDKGIDMESAYLKNVQMTVKTGKYGFIGNDVTITG